MSASLAIDGTKIYGEEVRGQIVSAAVSVANIVKTSLGPMGMDKMIVDNVGDVLVTNDGATILKRLDVEHPAARHLVELAQRQDSEIGDGTTSVVVIAAELLKRANALAAQHTQPAIIVSGYRWACKEAIHFIKNSLSKHTDSLGKDVLLNVAKTSMSSKIVNIESDLFARMVVDAVTSVRTYNDLGDSIYNVKAINILKQHGMAARDSMLINGFALPMARAAQGMPTSVQGAKIALCDFDLRVSKMKLSLTIKVSKASDVEGLKQREVDITKERIESMIAAGANVILTTGGIDDVCMKYLVERNVLGVRRVDLAQLKSLAKATGGEVVKTLADLEGGERYDPANLGEAELVSEERYADDEFIIVRGGKGKTNSSLLLRGANSVFLDEMERSLVDALFAVKRVLESPAVVAGGGATEAALSVHLQEFARSLASREQQAIGEFAQALLAIPKQLSVNAGLDAIDLTARLVNAHGDAAAGGKGHHGFGLDLAEGSIKDHLAGGILEPAESKIRQLKLATEVRCGVAWLAVT